MYAEDTTNKAKKRMLKGWAVQFADDKTNPKTTTASTVPQSKAFDTLLDITEEIETQSEILVSDLDKAKIETGQARFDTRSNEVVSRLYRDVRKGISALTKTNFKDLPRSDIGKLESYSNSLSGYYDRLNTINVETKDLNQPTGDPQGQVEDINRYIDFKNVEADEKKQLLGLAKREKININAREKKESDRLAKAIKDANTQKSKLEKELPKIDKELVKLRAEKEKIKVDYFDANVPQNDAIEERNTELDELIDSLEEDKVDIPERINEIKVELTDLNRARRDLTNETKRQTELIDKEIDDRVVELNQLKDDMTSVTRDLKAVEPMAVIEKGKAIKKQSSAIDFKLILQNYKVFLDTLTDGLRLYNSGLSGKVNKVGETVGSGMIGGSYIIGCGSADYMPRRFL